MQTLETSERIELQKKKKEKLYNQAHIGCNRCTLCKSSDYYKWTIPVFSFKGLLTGVEYVKDTYECKQCGRTWESNKYPK